MLNPCAELFVANLESKGMHFQSGTSRNGDSVVDFPYKGTTAKLFFSGDEGTYLSIYVVYERVPAEKLSDVVFICNDLNCRYKWATFYVDGDNDIVMHDDAILTVDNAADEAFELLVRLLKIGSDAKPELMRAIYA